MPGSYLTGDPADYSLPGYQQVSLKNNNKHCHVWGRGFDKLIAIDYHVFVDCFSWLVGCTSMLWAWWWINYLWKSSSNPLSSYHVSYQYDRNKYTCNNSPTWQVTRRIILLIFFISLWSNPVLISLNRFYKSLSNFSCIFNWDFHWSFFYNHVNHVYQKHLQL